jgi:prepilin-type processing-associated H-X9-DG protein
MVSCLLVAALFLPAFPAGRTRSRSAVCLNNLRQIDAGLNQYSLEFDQFLNASEWGAAALNTAGARFEPYLPQDPTALICPDKQRSVPTASRPEALVAFELVSYGYNGGGTAPDGRELELGMGLWRHIVTSRVKIPSDMIVLGDSGVGRQSSVVLSPYEIASLKQSAVPEQPQLPSARHNGGGNILFCDGHAAFGKQSKWIEKTPEARRQWNNDNQPHRENWP